VRGTLKRILRVREVRGLRVQGLVMAEQSSRSLKGLGPKTYARRNSMVSSIIPKLSTYKMATCNRDFPYVFRGSGLFTANNSLSWIQIFF
jgi:hypothetical protein